MPQEQEREDDFPSRDVEDDIQVQRYLGPRPGWYDYFLNIAEMVAMRATCPRAQVGAVLVKDNLIIATGYNGAPPGEPHCSDVGCQTTEIEGVQRHCERAVHAETNAIAQASMAGRSTRGSTMYFIDSRERNAEECKKCFQLMKAVGITNVVTRKGNQQLFDVPLIPPYQGPNMGDNANGGIQL